MRTEGDKWDIVSSVGRTALGVATFRALETFDPDPLIRDDYAPWFVEAAGEPYFTGLLADPSILMDTPFFPGFMGARTKFFDEMFLSASATGVRQAVIVAAGLDARAYRLDWPPGTTVFEIDQPKVLEFKQTVLTEHDARPKAIRRPVPVDLRDDWPAALRAAGFEPTMPAAWSIEGLLPYLPGGAQDALFERIDALSAPGTHLGAESFGTAADYQRLAAFELQYVDKSPFGDEDPVDLFYNDERADPMRWLTDNGWTAEAVTMEALTTTYGRPIPDLPDELVDLMQRPQYITATR
ncbi:class I SAM-dependent methyltransferase [Nocardia sp. CNY236]|uniref:class I SAM-dependent methyltransferase n=1 Tax=Nocardia sp. CNY236 TaxID=1169152 RepID=UPI00041E9877|nr:class I SAM-dependent methyltransferase [Nocardia sp. CNY236]